MIVHIILGIIFFSCLIYILVKHVKEVGEFVAVLFASTILFLGISSVEGICTVRITTKEYNKVLLAKSYR